jgi:hypothetical protein
MVIRRIAVLAVLLICTMHLPGTAFSANPPIARTASAQNMDFTLEGKITAMSTGKLTVSTTENIIFHVVYNDKTEIRKKDGSLGDFHDLHTGLIISVGGDLEESGVITAKKIAIESDASNKQ